jgi:hypothetical protein
MLNIIAENLERTNVLFTTESLFLMSRFTHDGVMHVHVLSQFPLRSSFIYAFYL